MARIKVEGLGIVEIDGETPNAQEIEAIQKLLNTKVSDTILSIEEYKKKNPDSANIPDLELAEFLYRKNFEGKISEKEFYEKAFPKITAKKPEEDLVEPLPEVAIDYLKTKGIEYSVTENESFKPTITEIAERSNVSAQDPASYEARKIGSFGYNQEQKEFGIKKSLSKLYNQDIELRIGPNTGKLEFFNPKIKKFSLVDQPGFDIGDFGDAYGDALVLGPDLVVTIVMGALTGPVGGISAGALAAAAGEFFRLKLGQKHGINQGLDDYALFKEGIKTGLISGIAGTAGLGVGYIIKGVNNMFAGRSFHFKNSDILQEEKLLEANKIQNTINQTLEDANVKANLKFSLGKAADDAELMSVQQAFEMQKKLGKVDKFRDFNKNEAIALNEYFGVLKSGFGTSNNTTFNTGKLIQEVFENRQKPIIKEAITKQEQAEELLTKSIFKLPDGSEKVVGVEFRSILGDIGNNYKELVDKAAKGLDNAAGTKIIGTDKIAEALKKLSIKDQRSLIEVSKLEGIFKKGVYESLREPDSKILLSDARETISALGKLIREKFENKVTGETVDTGKLLKLQSSFLEQLNKDAGTGYMDQLQNFNNLVRQNKELLDNDLISKLTKIEVGNKLKIADEDVFLHTFKKGSGNGKAAKEVYDVISKSPEALIAYKNAIFDFYKRKVLPEGKVNLTTHKTFMKDYEKPLRVFFNETEYAKISKIGGLQEYLAKANKSFELIQKNLAKSFEGKIINTNPGEVFNKIFKPYNLEDISKLKNILKNDKEVFKSFQRDVLTDLNEKVMVTNDKLGMKVINAEAFDRYLNGKGGERGAKAALRIVFGEQYVKNLDILNKALLIASRKAPASGDVGVVGTVFSDIIRAQVGQFTKLGRLFTASRRLFRTAANRIIANALLDPKSLELLIQLRKFKTLYKKFTTRDIYSILGKLGGSIFILPDEGEIDLPTRNDQVSEGGGVEGGEGGEGDIVQMASLPERVTPELNTPQLNTPGISEALLTTASTRPTGINATGLTPTELGLLSPEEQAIRLRQRGMA